MCMSVCVVLRMYYVGMHFARKEHEYVLMCMCVYVMHIHSRGYVDAKLRQFTYFSRGYDPSHKLFSCST